MNKIIILFSAILMCCNSTKEVNNSRDLRPIIIYKTRNNYFNNVPVILNSSKDSIVSYPAISDVYLNGELAIPTQLNNGYLLDNRGINENVAFTSFTYHIYNRLEKTPEANELYQKIIDKNPLIEIHRCNCKRSNSAYNKEIKNGFKNCKSIKYE